MKAVALTWLGLAVITGCQYQGNILPPNPVEAAEPARSPSATVPALSPAPTVAQAAPTHAPPPGEPEVVMAPYPVTPFRWWSLSFKYDRENRIREIVFYVERGSPAADAGLKTGDRLIAYEGKPVLGLTSTEFDKVAKDDGRTLHYTIVRDGRPLDVIVTIPSAEQRPYPALPPEKTLRQRNSR